MKTILFILITLLDILLITMGFRKNNMLFKIIGFVFLVPILFGIVSVIYQVFIA